MPPETVITHQAPYLLWPRGTPRDQAFLLGALSSMILDWYTRRVVEAHLTFHLFNNFPALRDFVGCGVAGTGGVIMSRGGRGLRSWLCW